MLSWRCAPRPRPEAPVPPRLHDVRSPPGRAERVVAAAIVLQLLAAVPSALALAPEKEAARPAAKARPAATRPAETERSAAVRALLARRSAAVLRHDKRAFLADVDPTQQK